MIRWLVVLALSFVIAVTGQGYSSTASAMSLKVAPLEYKTELSKGEKKKGFIDVSNPTGQRVVVRAAAQAFKQVDDKGSLQFVDNEAIRAGVKLDLDEFELGPREAVRMYFMLDGTKLPQGDVFAAIFFSTGATGTKDGVAQRVRVGTILSIVNGTPGARQAEITGLNTSFIQMSDTIRGSYTIKNTADPEKSTGFYPDVKLSVSPWGEQKQQTGKLIFAGRSRENSFEIKAPWVGMYLISVRFDDNSSRSQLVLVVKPIALAVFGVLAVLAIAGWKLRGRGTRKASMRLRR